jgi:hypothetical protein
VARPSRILIGFLFSQRRNAIAPNWRRQEGAIGSNATITDPKADLNLGLKYFLNGALVSDIVIDTTNVATDTVQYVATDPTGLTATSTRTVIIEALSPPTRPRLHINHDPSGDRTIASGYRQRTRATSPDSCSAR